MAEKQYYVKATFEFGTDVDGTLTPKNTGEALWVSMQWDDATVLQNIAIIPGITAMIEEAGKLGLERVGTLPPGQSKKV